MPTNPQDNDLIKEKFLWLSDAEKQQIANQISSWNLSDSQKKSIETFKESQNQNNNIPSDIQDTVQKSESSQLIQPIQQVPESVPESVPEPIQVPVPVPQIEPTEVNKPVEAEKLVNKEKPVITSIAEFKNAWGNKEQLAELIENRGAEDVQIFANRVVAEQNWERFEWSIDKSGNIIKNSLWTISNEKEKYAKDKGINFNVDSRGNLSFDPKNIDEALDIYDQFWKNVQINPSNKEAIRWSAVFKKYSKYKWADTNSYLYGLKNREIAIWGETWNLISRLNGGEPTLQMIEAREIFEIDMKTTDINNNGRDIVNIFSDVNIKNTSTENDFQDAIRKLDSNYISAKASIFSDFESMYSQFRQWTVETNNLRTQANETASQIDSLQTEKRKILKGIKKRFPSLPLSAQLELAKNETQAVNDEIFALQRQYNMENSDYQYSDTQDKAEFESNIKISELKQGLISEIYESQRGDLIRREDILRADRTIKENRVYVEGQRQQAIKDWDTQRAKDFSYQVMLLEEKNKLNRENEQKFSTANIWDEVLILNKRTWEYEISGSTWWTTWWVIWVVSGTSFTIPTGLKGAAAKNNNPWNIKMSPVNEWLAIGQDSRGHLIFPDMQTGIQALINDVWAKLEGRTTTGLTPESTLNDLASVYQQKTGGQWVNAINSVTWYTWDMNLKDLELSKLIPWIIKAETSWITEFIWDWVTEFIWDSFSSLSRFDQEQAKNYVSSVLRWSQAPKISKDIKSAWDFLIDKVYESRLSNPQLSNIFNILSKWSSKLSNEEWANIWKSEVEFALDWDVQKFKDQIRVLSDKVFANSDIKVQELWNKMGQYDRIEELLNGIDSNKWKQLQKEIRDSVWVTSWEDFDRIKTAIWLNAALFVKEISGAAVTDDEFKRLSALLPWLWDNIELAKNKLKEFRLQRYENTINPAISVIWNKRDVFFDLYPELQWRELYIENNEIQQLKIELRSSNTIIPLPESIEYSVINK